MHITAIEPPGPHPAPVAAIAAPGAASQDQPWHLEFNAGALVASGIYPYWGTTAAALVRQTSMFRFGGALRMMTGGYLGHVVGEVTGSFGVVDAPSDRLTAIAELTAGSTIRGDTTESGADFGADGLRAGVRAMIDRRLAGPLRLQVGGGIDVLRRLVIPSAVAEPSTPSGSYIDYALCPHIEAGLRWAP
jgi:hypothetical protein